MNNLLNYRRGDATSSNRDQDDRYFSLDGKWFFTTREGLTMGPYDSRAQAISETRNYIAFINAASSPVLSVIKREKATISPDSTEE